MKEKPYKELKDSDGRPDDEVSREAWDYHLSRNRSVIVDLFQGQVLTLTHTTHTANTRYIQHMYVILYIYIAGNFCGIKRSS